jgi:hypothetical protein
MLGRDEELRCFFFELYKLSSFMGSSKDSIKHDESLKFYEINVQTLQPERMKSCELLFKISTLK